ncbi:MAG: hypothetical protein JEZ03_02585 [Bacteroidales bacterium]|nr:hypothetical protein [Bacteroidales bacterium]
MKNKHLVILLISLAWITIQMHNVLPHHHHDKYATGKCQHECESHSGEQKEDHNEGHCNFAKDEIRPEQDVQLYVYFSNAIKIIIPETPVTSYKPQQLELPENRGYLFTIGLRGPPVLA